jgi:hypothetical protein
VSVRKQEDAAGGTEPPAAATADQVYDKLLQGYVERDKTEDAAERIAKHARKKRRIELMSSDELATESRRHDLILRKRIGIFAIAGVSAELVIANVVFVAYAWAGEHWKVPTVAINVWLGATVIQIFGILYVITNYLFPKSGTPLSRDE